MTKNYTLREFTADDNSFSFSYPEFKGWEVISTHINEEVIPQFIHYFILNNPTKIKFKVSPQFIVSKKTSKLATLPGDAKKNSNGIYYYDYNPNNANKVVFQTAGFAVNIQLNHVSDKDGFSRKKFFEKIINTFNTTSREK